MTTSKLIFRCHYLVVYYYFYIILLLSPSCFILVAGKTQANDNNNNDNINDEDDKLLSWKGCSIFMAPSKLASKMGWGVFAGRDFVQGEIVEVAPFFLPMDPDDPLIANSALDDYVYGYYRFLGGELLYYSAVVFGLTMIYNHHPTPNLVYTTFGREPDPATVPFTTNAIGFVALRDISAGEELFSTYGAELGYDVDDIGKEWFRERQIPLQAPNLKASSLKQDDQEIPSYKERYCSKLHAGMGYPAWTDRLEKILPPNVPFTWRDTKQQLAPMNVGAGSVIAKTNVKRGERLETGPGLVLAKSFVKRTIVRPFVIDFYAIDEYKKPLMDARNNGSLKLQYQSDYTDWNRIDSLDTMDDFFILPIAGNMGLVGRTSNAAEANCRFVIHSAFQDNEESGPIQGITLELVATKDIASGEIVQVDLSPPEFDHSHQLLGLTFEMKQTGQVHVHPPHNSTFFSSTKSKYDDEL